MYHAAAAQRCAGPSPRVWGKPLCAGQRRLDSRSIPTGVGKTKRRTRLTAVNSVHPHGCGENEKVGENAFKEAVHPHGCGENADPQTGISIYAGPSPRVWGKRSGGSYTMVSARSIPTGVGKTRSRPRQSTPIPVHPHGCGENSYHAYCSFPTLGPSPRVWGKQYRRFSVWYRGRSIPTGVGKTSLARPSSMRIPVHPHGCGENAGKRDKYRERSVHPHGCGENSASRLYSASANGPSPRVWGKPQYQRTSSSVRRSIPTGVGKT